MSLGLIEAFSFDSCASSGRAEFSEAMSLGLIEAISANVSATPMTTVFRGDEPRPH